MSKLHHCDDGMPVTDKVLLYQQTKSNEDYLPIHRYYGDYKEKWHMEVEDYLDRTSFDSEYDFKLCRAVDTFDEEQARSLCDKYKWSFLGAFNRWFFKVLLNWKSNVKTSAFRRKKRPAVHCPVCGRYVSKIDELHLQHIKGKSDLPKVFNWRGSIYSVATTPGPVAYSWGPYSLQKMKKINNGGHKEYRRAPTEWLWYTKDGKRGVVCPFTKKVLSKIDEEHLKSLPDKYNRYARRLTWQEFIEEYPYPVLIQSEIYSLDYNLADEEAFLKSSISVEEQEKDHYENDGAVSIKYEHSFHLIETHITDEIDQKILKLAAAGHSDADVATILEIDRKDVRKRKKEIKLSNEELRKKLLESV